MRALTPLFTLALTLAAAGCDAELPAARDGAVSETIGSMERVRPDDPSSPWVGVETVRIVGSDGALLCEGDVDLDAVPSANRDCPTCALTLDVVRSTVHELADSCEFEVDPAQVARSERYLSFEPSLKGDDFSAGRVLTAASPHGPWRDLAGGVFDGDSIVYHRSEVLRDRVEIDDPSGFSPRELPRND